MTDQVLNVLGLVITGILPVGIVWWLWNITGQKGRKR